MNVKDYLGRIRYAGEENCDIPMLAALQEHHLYTVPFENIDIQSGIPIHLDPARFFNKIVLNQRGGYCYELNGLFHQLLMALGFDAYLISARVVKGKKYGPEFDHLAIVVNLDDRQWLVDVGYGDFALKPLLIEPGTVQFDGRHHYKIENNTDLEGRQYLSVGKWTQQRDAYVPAYLFSLTPRSLWEFEGMNHFHQTSPGSHFTQSLMCSMPNKEGRNSLINNRLIFSTGGVRKEMRVECSQIYQVLETHFGIYQEVGKTAAAMKYTGHVEQCSKDPAGASGTQAPAAIIKPS